jgi:hypothetical protein
MSKSVEELALSALADRIDEACGSPICIDHTASTAIRKLLALSIQQEADAKDGAMFRKLEKIMGRGEYMPGRDVHRAIEVLVDPNPNKPMPADCGFTIIRHYKWRIQGTSPDIRECLRATPTDSEDKTSA